MVKRCVKMFLEPFTGKGKNLPQKAGKSEISRWSNQLENVIFRLPTFFSKVSKIFPIGHITFIFSLRRVFIVILDPWKIWRAYDKTSPPSSALRAGGHRLFAKRDISLTVHTSECLLSLQMRLLNEDFCRKNEKLMTRFSRIISLQFCPERNSWQNFRF